MARPAQISKHLGHYSRHKVELLVTLSLLSHIRSHIQISPGGQDLCSREKCHCKKTSRIFRWIQGVRSCSFRLLNRSFYLNFGSTKVELNPPCTLYLYVCFLIVAMMFANSSSFEKPFVSQLLQRYPSKSYSLVFGIMLEKSSPIVVRFWTLEPDSNQTPWWPTC